ncbi:SDR family NAD(P)-dependent oxidoreductase [Chitinophaga nivalis]|uniref:SDR family NAD(P)-dependent oxidoreductase n=1 Tax=Chitinophaga nivalis TaxID=2991709 RepID=A0ABT3IG92_9BACT|nr:SDR family NAD(P)-dependent oxidoreductase [Chitinophaga nivalis]MCW3467342.1 SDR family NAD(P)-dependent oxidoreductase [Chitinophaga nivalis]MCW3482966.1 SDR family NAD(P)-dependent oxidoreductase [Chitinophaga nivalis]
MSYALVTGAAKGIGKAIAARLAEKNYHLLLVDIDADNLRETATELAAQYHVNVHTLHQDLSHPDVLQQVLAWSTPYHDHLTVVVNNAGYGLNGAFETLSLTEQFNVIDVNIKAQVGLSYAYIPVLRQFPKAYLLNVASTTAYQTVPYLNIYASTKAFALSFTRGLRHELRHSTISVSALSPGSTDTDFVNRARMGSHTRSIANRFNMTAASVGKIAVDGLFKGKAEIIPGFTNKLNAWLPKFFPKAFVERIAGNIYEPKEETPAAVLSAS